MLSRKVLPGAGSGCTARLGGHFERGDDGGGGPIFGDSRLVERGADDGGRFSFGSLRDSENAPLALRCLPKFGFRVPAMVDIVLL